MLITLQDDGVLRIYATIAEAVLDVEALDAEDTFRRVFDETGQRYAIRWIRENRKWWVVMENGVYTFAPEGDVDAAGLLQVIRGARYVEPESLRPWLRELESRLASR